jgi:hypothetical protein
MRDLDCHHHMSWSFVRNCKTIMYENVYFGMIIQNYCHQRNTLIKRQLKQWWSTIQPVATQRTYITSQLKSLKTHTHTHTHSRANDQDIWWWQFMNYQTWILTIDTLRGHYCMTVGFYKHLYNFCEFDSRPWGGVFDTAFCFFFSDCLFLAIPQIVLWITQLYN